MTKGELIMRLIQEAWDDNTEVTVRLVDGTELAINAVSLVEDHGSETDWAVRLHADLPVRDVRRMAELREEMEAGCGP